MPEPSLVLIVDDDPASRRLLAECLKTLGHEVLTAFDGESAVTLALARSPDAVVCDLHLPGMSGIDVLQRLAAADPGVPVLFLAERGEVPRAVRATEGGAFAYLTKSLDLDEVALVLRRALEHRALRREVEELRGRLDEGGDLQRTMGPSRKIRRVIEQVRQAAASSFTVLVTGETGTGKEVVARAIHANGSRRNAPFIALDCGAIPEALIESELFGHETGARADAEEPRGGPFRLAQGGTLFLDELASMPLALQSKLLQVLEERVLRPRGAKTPVPLDVRFVAATNIDLEAEIAKGRFRRDLYFRLAELAIALPPLRARLEDVPYLARRFAEEAGIDLRKPARELAPAALDRMLDHPWPGNVRELRGVVRRCVHASEDLVITAAEVASAIGAESEAPSDSTGVASVAQLSSSGLLNDGLSLREVAARAVEKAERAAITAALESAGGNKSEAARRLRTDYKTLHVKIRLYGLR